jgi:two-component sensor histidine kinase
LACSRTSDFTHNVIIKTYVVQRRRSHRYDFTGLRLSLREPPVAGRAEIMAVRIPGPPNVADSLILAMVASSDAPLILLDGDLKVIAASISFGRAFRVDPAEAPGRSIFELGSGEWNLPKLRSLLSATASGQAAIEAYEMDLKGSAADTRRLVIKAQKLEYGDAKVTRILMTLCDVTDARLAEKFKDDLLRERAILLEEVQHRVANSLQIIASVLLQSARTVQSEETRTHLQDAHNRVMSIATVQKQLASTGQVDVELRPYFTQLCQSLGASMIRDHNKQTIDVTGDKSSVGADVSVSLGLIVTELVINALKHAFPEGRPGRITVDYQSHGPNWTLAVNDDGLGMHQAAATTTSGLGTSIVEALARQLRARVQVSDRRPGTGVSIIHTQIAAVDPAAEPPVERAV